jgi:hypothetical protein
MNTIDIGTVLQRFDDTYDEKSNAVKEYGLRFLTSDGRHREMRCRKGVKAPQQQIVEGGNQPRGKFRFNLKYHGSMLLHDMDINETRSVKVSMIFGFKDFKTNTWLNVFH